jgi:hypothetical protein
VSTTKYDPEAPLLQPLCLYATSTQGVDLDVATSAAKDALRACGMEPPDVVLHYDSWFEPHAIVDALSGLAQTDAIVPVTSFMIAAGLEALCSFEFEAYQAMCLLAREGGREEDFEPAKNVVQRIVSNDAARLCGAMDQARQIARIFAHAWSMPMPKTEPELWDEYQRLAVSLGVTPEQAHDSLSDDVARVWVQICDLAEQAWRRIPAKLPPNARAMIDSGPMARTFQDPFSWGWQDNLKGPLVAAWRADPSAMLACARSFRGCGGWSVVEFPALDLRMLLVCRRPVIFELDALGRLHKDGGPALAWANGLEAYSLEGQAMPATWIRDPLSVPLSAVVEERNAERRRILRVLYGDGRYLRDVGAEVIDVDAVAVDRVSGGGGTITRALLRTNDGEQYLVGSDGSTDRVYHMRVPPNVKTCHAAHEAISAGIKESDIQLQS